MATAHITYGAVTNWGGQLVWAKAPRVAELVISSGAHAVGSQSATVGEFARVTATDADLYAAVVSAVSDSTGYRITAGATESLGPLSAGDKIAIISA